MVPWAAPDPALRRTLVITLGKTLEISGAAAAAEAAKDRNQ